MKIFIAAGCVEAPSISELTKAQIQKCIEGRCKKDANGDQLYLVDQAIRSVSKIMNIIDAENRVGSLRRDYTNTLRAARNVNIAKEKPHISINYVLQILKPVQLNRRMQDNITWRKNESFHKKNLSGL